MCICAGSPSQLAMASGTATCGNLLPGWRLTLPCVPCLCLCQVTRVRYSPVAKRGAILFFVMASLSSITNM